jgi:hypothetical protein
LLSKSMAVNLGPDNIRGNAICPVIGGSGLPEQFMGVPDTPKNRAKCMATIPPGGRGLRWSGGSGASWANIARGDSYRRPRQMAGGVPLASRGRLRRIGGEQD